MAKSKQQLQEEQRFKDKLKKSTHAGSRPRGWETMSEAEQINYYQSLPEHIQRRDAAAYKGIADKAAATPNAQATAVSDQRFAEDQRVAGEAAASQQASNRTAIDRANSGYRPTGGFSPTGGNNYGAGFALGPKAPTTFAPEGIDQTNQGVGEQLWGLHGQDFFKPSSAAQFSEEHKATFAGPGFGETRGREVSDALKAPGAGEEYWQGVSGKYNDGGPSYVQDAYGSFDAAVDPNLGGYYDHAWNQASSGINKQLASRGQYGSSAGMQQLGNVATGLGAERANREAAYGLDRFRTKMAGATAASNDEQGWVKGLGDIAFAADASQRGRLNDSAGIAAGVQGQEMDRIGQGHAQATSNDARASADRNAGYDAAFGAQDRRDRRIQNGFENQMGFGAVLSGMGTGRIAGDYAAATGGAEAGLAGTTDDVAAQRAEAERLYQEYLAGQTSGGRAVASYAPKPVAPKGK